MPSANFLEWVPHAPDCVMSLVTDVEHYPDFIPAMTALRKTKDLPDGFEAEAMINYKGIAEIFSSRVKIDQEQRLVTVEKARKGGPVKKLHNRWQFHELSDGSTLVDFQVEVRLAFPLEALLKQKFDKARTVIKDVFIEQAAGHCVVIASGGDVDLVAEATHLDLSHRLA